MVISTGLPRATMVPYLCSSYHSSILKVTLFIYLLAFSSLSTRIEASGEQCLCFALLSHYFVPSEWHIVDAQ